MQYNLQSTCTHIAWHSGWADADVEIFTGLKAGRRRAGFFRHVGTSDVSHQGSTLCLTNGQPLSIVISHMLLLSTTVHKVVNRQMVSS